MKKSFLCLCLLLALTILSPLPAAACWMAPEPFEIFSDDASKVFVFTPAEDGMASANAAVYEIIDNQRQLVYTVEGLASFAYESNFHFSTDMMHFARIFPPSGMDAFEVFSYGVRTRVVIRSDFIEDNASIQAETSVGPMYTVSWRIEGHPSQGATITINTDEDSAILFDLATATFTWEDALPVYCETPTEVSPAPMYQTQNSPALVIETNPEALPAPAAQTPNSRIGFFVIAGAAFTFLAAGVFLWRKSKR